MVMATPSKPVGYECEFVDQVPEDYFCKQCSHVAREPNITSCCGEILCKACVGSVVQDKKPCPNCQETDINYIPHKKYKPKILALKVHCSLKDRGCEWTGQLQHLNAHLDLTTGDCVYVDVDCPSKCDQKVQKCNVDTHLANHCPNRDYICPHCSFKATFHEVSEHFEVCPYYPLVCSNRCGASFERDVLEDHMKMCGLQKLQCEFSYAGCGAEFIRDHQKEHMEQNTQKHLALVAAATLRISQMFEQKFQEQQREFDQKLEDKHSEIKAIVNKTSQLVNEQRQQSDAQIKDFKEKLQEQQQNFEQSIRKKDELAKKELEEQQAVYEEKLGELREDFHKQQRMLEEKLEVRDQQIETLVKYHGSNDTDNLRMEVGILPYEFTFSYKYNSKSPHMYTHPGGYKFYMSLWPRGVGNDVAVTVYSAKGFYDHKLKFPARFTITLELLNQHRDHDHYSRDIKWAVHRPSSCDHGDGSHFIPVTDLKWNVDRQTQYLKNDCLKLRICKITKN